MAPDSNPVEEARRELIHHFTGNPDEEFDGPCEVVDDFESAVRASERASRVFSAEDVEKVTHALVEMLEQSRPVEPIEYARAALAALGEVEEG